MTDHSRYEELCLLRDSGELSPGDRHALEDHLLGCAGCRDFAEAATASSRSAMIASREPPAAVAEAVRSLLREEPVGSPWIPAAPLGVPRVPAWLRPVAALGLAAASIFSLLYWDASRAAPGGAGAPGTNRPATEPGHPRSGWARKWLELGRAETASRVSAAAAGGWANGLETELAQAETEVHRLDSALLAEYFEEDLVEDFRELERSKRTLEMELQDL